MSKRTAPFTTSANQVWTKESNIMALLYHRDNMLANAALPVYVITWSPYQEEECLDSHGRYIQFNRSNANNAMVSRIPFSAGAETL